MKKLIPIFMVCILVAINVGVSSALPVCKDSPRIISDYKEVKSWSDCHGTLMFAKSVGQSKGALVNSVAGDSPAFKGGIKRGDVIVRFDGKDVKVMEDLPKIVTATTPGSVVNVEIIREGSPKTLSAKIGTPPRLGVMIQRINPLAGTTYVGEFKYGKPNGQGTQTFTDGGKYVGEWKDGIRHGQGTDTIADGGKYVGEWKDGWKHGQGTQTFADGGKYVGELKYGKPNGQGTLTHPNGDKHVGGWKDGKLHGQGTNILLDGRKYVGEFKDLNWVQGTLTHPNGDKIVGRWKDGKLHGQVFEIDHDGGGKHSEWKDGKRIKVLKQFHSDRSLKEYQQNFIKQNASAQRLEGYNASPPQQIFLERLISTTKSTISADYNSAKKKRAWIRASRKLCSSQDFDVTREKVDWVGYVDHVLMDDDGSVSLKVSINKHGNKVLDKNLNEQLIDIALELKESSPLTNGEFIKFSGYFKKGDMTQNECLDAGIDSNPELGNESFTFKFTKIQREGSPDSFRDFYDKFFGERPNQQPAAVAKADPLGMQLQDITPELAKNLKLEDNRGVWVSKVTPGNSAEESGIRRGDVISEMNRTPITNMKDYQRLSGSLKTGDSVLFLLKRGGTTIYIAVTVG